MKKGRIVLTVSRVANIAPEMKVVYLRLGKQVYTYDRESDSYLEVPALSRGASARELYGAEALTDVTPKCLPETVGDLNNAETRGGMGLKVPSLGSRTVKAYGKIPRIVHGQERLPQLAAHEAPLPKYPQPAPRYRKKPLPLRPEEPLPLRSEEPLPQLPEEPPRHRTEPLPVRPEKPTPVRSEEPLSLRPKEAATPSAEPTPAPVPEEEPRPRAVKLVERPDEVEVKVVPTPRKRQTRVPKGEGEPPAPATSKPLKVIRRRAEQAPKVFETTTTRFPKAMLEGIKINLDEEREVQ